MIHAALSLPATLRAGGAGGTLDTLRRRGVQLWAAMGWVVLLLLLGVNAALGAGVGGALLLIGCAANAGPTAMALLGRHDGEARAIVGSLAAFLPAMLVFVLRGHPWQMDAHMYFFVGMAALVVFADWRPLLVAAALTAVHHLLLDWLAPQWLFAGKGDIGRVLFHAAAVALQCGALVFLTRRLAQLVDAQDASVATAQALATTAEAERQRTLEAMERERATEARAAAERDVHRNAGERDAAARRRELVALAETFERSVSRVVDAIGEAARRLEGSSERLDAAVVGTDQVAGDVAAGASEAACEITLVATSIRELSASIRTIAATADHQIDLAGQARGEARRSVETIAMLEQRTTQIEGLAEGIRGIAGKTRLLALNATIEAARAGEAGRGFTIVAGEVKALAGESARASKHISELLAGIRAGVLETSTTLRSVNGTIGEVAAAADGIAAAVEQHHVTARGVGISTDRAAETSSDIGARIAGVAAVAELVTTLAANVRRSALDLTSSARELRGSADGFLSFLRGDQPAKG